MEQHMKALETANRNRVIKANIKRALWFGHIELEDIIVDPPSEIKNATLYEMLFSLGIGEKKYRRWHRKRALKFLQKVGISETYKIGNLTNRQVKQILEELP